MAFDAFIKIGDIAGESTDEISIEIGSRYCPLIWVLLSP